MSGRPGPAAEASLLSAAQLRPIIDGETYTAIISIDRAGFVTSWSLGAQRLLGWTEQEMLGQKLDRLFTEEDRKRGRLAREMSDALEHGRGGGEEGWRIRKDGSRMWAAGEMSPVRSEAGGGVGFTKVVRDRTAQRRAEDAAEQERRSLQILNRAGSALAIETDLTRLVQIVTDTGVELTGAEFGAFFYNLIDEAGESYMLYTLSGAPLEAFSKFPMPRNTQVFAPTFSGEGIVRSDDITKDPRYGRNAPRRGMPEGHLPVRSYLAVPVVSRTGEVLGGLFFGHSKVGVFSERAERLIVGIAAHASIAIDNARLYQAAQNEIAQRTKTEIALRRSEEEQVQLNQSLERK